MIETIKEKIQEADFVLVGVGQEMAWKEAGVFSGEEEWLNDYKMAADVNEVPQSDPILSAYEKLAQLLKGKIYFVVTMNADDLIYRSSLNREQIVAPCGSIHRLQCEEHVFDGSNEIERIRKALEEGTAPEKIQKPHCPICQKEAMMNTVKTPGYLEEGYLPDWERYRKWLSCTLNKKLCILELGVGFQYPSVIRWPFEKTAFLNQKASLVRVNSKFFQISEELKGKAISIAENPVDLLNEQENGKVEEKDDRNH
ncbi:MAG: hypothetical protein SO016_00520 [Lachnospiraceae bacterium]|nr:hypothetical protein [Robinsoniella sp.]MDY3765170.1 hypothetical protein [Lachnospiraceae bacterium]